MECRPEERSDRGRGEEEMKSRGGEVGGRMGAKAGKSAPVRETV